MTPLGQFEFDDKRAMIARLGPVPADTRIAVRRRGEVLREAVFEAALAEIGEHGVRGASMDRIAKRAGTGKAALYRRWPNVRALALDVFVSTLEESLPDAENDTGSLRSVLPVIATRTS